MALISCPECTREISDKVQSCPHCGYPLKEKAEDSAQKVEITSVKIKGKLSAKTQKIIALVLIAAIAVVASLAYANKQSQEQAILDAKEARNNYIDVMQNSARLMLSGGSEAEGLLILTRKVWLNSINKTSDQETNAYTIMSTHYKQYTTSYSSYAFETDFNVALRKFSADSTAYNKKSLIRSNQDTVSTQMAVLQSPPLGLEKAYDTALELYVAYQGLTNLALNPSGSLTTFTQESNSRVSSFLDLYRKLDTMIPQKQP